MKKKKWRIFLLIKDKNENNYFRGTNWDPLVAPIPGAECLTCLHVGAYSPK
jgi:hypothetical protein